MCYQQEEEEEEAGDRIERNARWAEVPPGFTRPAKLHRNSTCAPQHHVICSATTRLSCLSENLLERLTMGSDLGWAESKKDRSGFCKM